MVISDSETRESFVNFEAERRLRDTIKIEFETRLTAAASHDEPLYSFTSGVYLRSWLSCVYN